MSEGLCGVKVNEVDDHNSQLGDFKSGEDNVSSPLFDFFSLSAEDQKQFQEMLSGEPSGFCPKRWNREE